MSRVLEAIHWDGVTPVVSLFLVCSAEVAPDLEGAWASDVPRRTKVYRLEDGRPTYNSPPVYEYDFEFDVLPGELELHLQSCLRMACEGPDSVAWLAFEGSFHFDHILAESVANQVYGICATGDPPLVVLDDDPAAQAALAERMRNYRVRFRLG